MSIFARRRENLSDAWLPLLVALIGILASLAAWGILITERRDQILEETREVAAGTRRNIQAGLAQQVQALEGLRAQWSEFSLGSESEWSVSAGQQVEQVPGLAAVAWVDRQGAAHRMAVAQGRPAESVAFDPQSASRHADARHLSEPRQDEQGRVSYRIFMPLETPREGPGVVVGVVDVAPFLDDALRTAAQGYALSVRWGGDEIYQRGTPTPSAWQRWWRVEEAVPLPFDGRWRVVYRPTADLVAMRLNPMPHYLLAAGILLSILGAVAVHQLRVIVRQSRVLAASNRALEQRGQELETKVTQRTQALEDAVAELESFNYSVSHDLRSPLGAILNFSMILGEEYRDRPLGDEGLRIIERIRRSATRANALLEDLLQLSRAGRAALAIERVDMTSLARETFAQVSAAEDATDVEFRVEPLPEVAGDRALLGNVFGNLFSNALKYSRGRNGRRITVTGRIEKDKCIYEVVDNGQGFDMRFVDKVFGLFERLHTSEEIEGTGVGLAMVARIVKRHGGRVWAEGRPGEGARFSFAILRRGVS